MTLLRTDFFSKFKKNRIKKCYNDTYKHLQVVYTFFNQDDRNKAENTKD